MSAQHTPGPWAVTSSAGDIHSQVRNTKNWICQGPNSGALSSPPVDEMIANFHLISAGPDLLQACAALVILIATDARYDGSECIQMGRDAIVKAKGEI